MANRAIIYTVGGTHQIFFNLSDEEAEKRWQRYREDMNQFEIELEAKKGLKPSREIVEFEDELLIWGNVNRDIMEMLALVMDKADKI